MHWMIYVFAGYTGAAIGSFCSVLVHRLPVGKSVVTGRSVCLACQRQLRWFELIPILSYFAQFGKCRRCGQSFGFDYLVREVAIMVLMVVMLHGADKSSDFVLFGMLSVLLIVIAEIDCRHYIIPNKLIAFGSIAGAGLTLAFRPESLLGMLGAAFCTVVLLMTIREGSNLLFGRFGLGIGDIKLAAMIACFIGWQSLWAFYLAAVLGGVAGITGIAVGRLSRLSCIPFAPFIAMGVACSFFLDPLDVISWLSA